MTIEKTSADLFYDDLNTFLQSTAFFKLSLSNRKSQVDTYLYKEIIPKLKEKHNLSEQDYTDFDILRFVDSNRDTTLTMTKPYKYTKSKFDKITSKLETDGLDTFIDYDLGEYVIKVENTTIIFSMKYVFGYQIIQNGVEIINTCQPQNKQTIKALKESLISVSEPSQRVVDILQTIHDSI